jgi:hypothetical protein
MRHMERSTTQPLPLASATMVLRTRSKRGARKIKGSPLAIAANVTSRLLLGLEVQLGPLAKQAKEGLAAITSFIEVTAGRFGEVLGGLSLQAQTSTDSARTCPCPR